MKVNLFNNLTRTEIIDLVLSLDKINDKPLPDELLSIAINLYYSDNILENAKEGHSLTECINLRKYINWKINKVMLGK